jgi:hypothetical protein
MTIEPHPLYPYIVGRVDGITCAQHPGVLAALEALQANFTPTRIAEIGTQLGGLTLLLNHYFPHVEIHTFDIADWQGRHPFTGMNVTFHQCDVMAHRERVIDLMIPGCLLICDGGHKEHEFNAFSEHLKPGSVIMAHDFYSDGVDWPSFELFPEQVAGACERCGLEPLLDDIMKKAVFCCRCK